jgi:hypothetical protein
MTSILVFFSGLISGIVIGIFGTFWGNRLTDRAKDRDSKREILKKFQIIKSKMPELLNEMKSDLKKPELKLCREFVILPSKSVIFNASRNAFAYFENEHDNLISKVLILKTNEYVYDITDGNVPRYQFDEDFVDMLTSDK